MAGRKAYRRWRLRQIIWVEWCRVEDAVAAGAGRRSTGARSAARLVRFLPWSASHVLKAIGVAILGPVRFEWVSRHLSWYTYRARKALGLRVSR